MFLDVDTQGWNFIEFEAENNAVKSLILTLQNGVYPWVKKPHFWL